MAPVRSDAAPGANLSLPYAGRRLPVLSGRR